jgi:protein-tyrosine phosphatase
MINDLGDDVKMSEVIPGKLYLGGLWDATSFEQLQEFNITAILDVASNQNQPTYGRLYSNVRLIDGPGNMPRDFEQAVLALESLMNDSAEVVLIHCHAGVSRSPTICATYLAKKNKTTFDEAVASIRLNRQFIDPHPALRKMARQYLREID